MSLVSVIFLICLTVGIACLVYIRLKERRLIEQVTFISRGEWSERRVVLIRPRTGAIAANSADVIHLSEIVLLCSMS